MAVEGSRNVDFWLFLGEECQVEVLFENEVRSHSEYKSEYGSQIS